MAIIPRFAELLEPYTEDGSTTDLLYKFLTKQCKNRDIPIATGELALIEVFTEMANGKTFPKDHCPCGCGINKSSTALAHEILSRAIAMDREQKAEATQRLEDRITRLILGHIEAQNAEFVAANLPAKKPNVFKRIWREAMDRGVIEQ